MPSRRDSQSILVVAGEASSDEHAAGLVAAIKERAPEISFFGMGGSRLREVGVSTVVDSEEVASVMGIFEVIGSLRKIIRAFYRVLDEASKRKPSLAILVDFPDFNLRLAKKLRKKGIPVFYYVAPQVWAWRRGRVRTIRKNVDFVATIFPFEEKFFKEHGVEAAYVGHPFGGREPLLCSRDEFLRSLGLNPARPVLALLPGSRKPEVERLLEPLLKAASLVRKASPELQVLIPVARTLERSWFEKQLKEEGVVLLPEQAREALHAADAAVVSSGTATLEAALEGNPFIVVYRFSSFTIGIARLLVRGVSHFAMPNLIAQKEIVPELLQEEVTGENVARYIEQILGDVEYASKIREDLKALRRRLDSSGTNKETAPEKAAALALELIERKAS